GRDRPVDRSDGARTEEGCRCQSTLHSDPSQFCPIGGLEEERLLQYRRPGRRGTLLGHLPQLEAHSTGAAHDAAHASTVESCPQGCFHDALLVRLKEDPRRDQSLGTKTRLRRRQKPTTKLGTQD